MTYRSALGFFAVVYPFLALLTAGAVLAGPGPGSPDWPLLLPLAATPVVTFGLALWCRWPCTRAALAALLWPVVWISTGVLLVAGDERT